MKPVVHPTNGLLVGLVKHVIRVRPRVLAGSLGKPSPAVIGVRLGESTMAALVLRSAAAIHAVDPKRGWSLAKPLTMVPATSWTFPPVNPVNLLFNTPSPKKMRFDGVRINRVQVLQPLLLESSLRLKVHPFPCDVMPPPGQQWNPLLLNTSATVQQVSLGQLLNSKNQQEGFNPSPERFNLINRYPLRRRAVPLYRLDKAERTRLQTHLAEGNGLPVAYVGMQTVYDTVIMPNQGLDICSAGPGGLWFSVPPRATGACWLPCYPTARLVVGTVLAGRRKGERIHALVPLVPTLPTVPYEVALP